MKSDKKSKRFSFFQKGGNTMRKKMTLLIMAVVIGMLFTACSESFVEDPNLQTEKEEEQETVPESPENTENIESEAIEYRYTEEGYIVPEQAEEIIKEISDTVLKAIAEKDVKTWAAYVHPEKGVRFTPYTYVEKDKDIIFTKDQIESFFDNEKTYLWGYYVFSGIVEKKNPVRSLGKSVHCPGSVAKERIPFSSRLFVGYSVFIQGSDVFYSVFFRQQGAVERIVHGEIPAGEQNVNKAFFKPRLDVQSDGFRIL
jgi:hypothetical protein